MIRPLLVLLLSLIVLAVSQGADLKLEHTAGTVQKQVRILRVQQQRAEQQLHRLDNGHTDPLMKVLGEDLSSLQVRVAEFLSAKNADSSDVPTVIAYQQSIIEQNFSTGHSHEIPVNPDRNIQILRVDVQLQLAHAPALLDVLNQLMRAVGGWPADVRACDVQRAPVQHLNVQCVVDVYFWQVDNENR